MRWSPSSNLTYYVLAVAVAVAVVVVVVVAVAVVVVVAPAVLVAVAVVAVVLMQHLLPVVHTVNVQAPALTSSSAQVATVCPTAAETARY